MVEKRAKHRPHGVLFKCKQARMKDCSRLAVVAKGVSRIHACLTKRDWPRPCTEPCLLAAYHLKLEAADEVVVLRKLCCNRGRDGHKQQIEHDDTSVFFTFHKHFLMIAALSRHTFVKIRMPPLRVNLKNHLSAVQWGRRLCLHPSREEQWQIWIDLQD